jgi:hypothetical protein
MPQARSSKASITRPCPACAGPLRASTANHPQRVRCPNCLQIVVLDPPAAEDAKGTATAPARSSIAPAVSKGRVPRGEAAESGDPGTERLSAARRIELLEQRVAALEAALAEARVTVQPESSRLKWLPQGPEADLTDWRADVLCHNLGTIPAHRITIQFRGGDDHAWRTACWFKRVFERATWLAQGPVEAPKGSLSPGLCLSTTLPVPARPAATYMAIRAAGFVLHAEFDPDARGDEARLVVA